MLPASLLKYKRFLVFSGVTLLFIVSKWVLFTNFNGADDLHYAMLAAKMTKGQFNPFEPNDIYSGRILLISIQALIYKIFGISILSTSIGTIASTITACYLTIFQFLKKEKASAIFLLCCIFYFSPVLVNSIIGVMPDSYIMLAGVIVLLLLKKTLKKEISPAHKKNCCFLLAVLLQLLC